MRGNGNKQVRAALPPGYSLRHARKHMLLVAPDGELVRHPNGRPFVVSKGGKINSGTLEHMLRALGRIG